MLVFQYTKLQSASYVSHLDLLRTFTRIFRRAHIEVGFSEGFSPHMLVYFCPPLPVGTESSAEYCAVDCSLLPVEFMSRFNAVTTEYIRCVACITVAKNPNLAANIVAADYKLEFSTDVGLSSLIKEIMSSSCCEITYRMKGQTEKKDYRAEIYDLKSEGNCVFARLAVGNKTLRADRLAAYIIDKTGCGIQRICRVGQYVMTNDEFRSVL